MALRTMAVIDGDGHMIESEAEIAEFADGVMQEWLHRPYRRPGIFPGLDGFHFPQFGEEQGEAAPPAVARPYVRASEARMGSGEDWTALLDRAEIEQAVLFPTLGLSVGFIQVPDYAVRLCRAFNDYVYHRYRKVDSRLHPVALIPMQDPKAAALELRRAVKELGLLGAMLPSTGLPMHLGHEYYFPVYQEAADLGCVLAAHGGSNRGLGMDTFTNFTASHILHHPMPLAMALCSMVYHGVFERWPGLRVGFMEGGAAWLALVLDRAERDEKFEMPGVGRRRMRGCLDTGNILIGCEGEDPTLPYLVSRTGAHLFAYSSDYPHETDLVRAQEEIEETVTHTELSASDKVAILGENSRRFFITR